VTPEARKIILEMRARGYIQSDIAAVVGTNQGRISEVLNGKR
jgi:transcriptional regulator